MIRRPPRSTLSSSSAASDVYKRQASTTAAAASTAAAAAAGAGEPAVTVRSTVGLPPAGTEGSGVTVAVVDTGVADVPELAGRIVGHLDMSRSSNRDGFGHGTFM